MADKKKNLIIPLYLGLLAFHVAHILEEVWGRFFLMHEVFGLGWYVFLNWILFLIPLSLFYFVNNGNKKAKIISLFYAGIMILNGIGHNLLTIITGRYFNGFAGGISGLGLIFFGIPLFVLLIRSIREPQRPTLYKQQ
jgi:hypothetical protein